VPPTESEKTLLLLTASSPLNKLQIKLFG